MLNKIHKQKCPAVLLTLIAINVDLVKVFQIGLTTSLPIPKADMYYVMQIHFISQSATAVQFKTH